MPEERTVDTHELRPVSETPSTTLSFAAMQVLTGALTRPHTPQEALKGELALPATYDMSPGKVYRGDA